MALFRPVTLKGRQRGPRWWDSRAVLLLVALTTAACSRTATSPTGAGPVDVQVTLTGSAITSSLTTFTVGVPYHFIVTNRDPVNVHEFMVLPPIAPGTLAAEEMDKRTIVHIEEADLPTGAKQTIDYTFTTAAPAGTLELACHLPGHYELGMHTPITVK